MGSVYLLTFASGKHYVGQARNLIARWRSHRFHARRGDRRHYPLYAAWAKYGEPKLTILFEGPASALNAVETEMIAEYGTVSPAGYNLAGGGAVPTQIHADTRKRISDSKKTPESLATIRRLHDPGIVAKAAATRRGRIRPAAAVEATAASKRSLARVEAIASGAKTYESEDGCAYGHAPIRFVSNHWCVQCARISVLTQREKRKRAAPIGAPCADRPGFAA